MVIFHYIDIEKVYSFGVIDNFMELVLNHHREMVLQLLQQLQQQLEFSLFENINFLPEMFFLVLSCRQVDEGIP